MGLGSLGLPLGYDFLTGKGGGRAKTPLNLPRPRVIGELRDRKWHNGTGGPSRVGAFWGWG